MTGLFLTSNFLSMTHSEKRKQETLDQHKDRLFLHFMQEHTVEYESFLHQHPGSFFSTLEALGVTSKLAFHASESSYTNIIVRIKNTIEYLTQCMVAEPLSETRERISWMLDVQVELLSFYEWIYAFGPQIVRGQD